MKAPTVAFLVTVSLLLLCRPSPAAADQQAIDRVKAGELEEAKASWWGFEPEDATRCLQAAIDSGVPRLIVDNVGQPWIVEPIRLVSNQAIVFEEGVEVLAKQGSFKGSNDSLITLSNLENVSLSGYGATLRMRRDDYDNPDLYQRAEWRHVLQIRSSRNVEVLGLTLAESGGDGIYLGVATRGVTNTNIHIKDVVCDKNYRQGISVITAENLLIEDTVMQNTAGTPPMAGIDFEPNSPDEKLVNCVMRNCVTQNNRSWGYALYIPNLHSSSAPASLRFENCKSIQDGTGAVAITTGNTPDLAVRGSIEFVNCDFQSPQRQGIAISSKPASGCSLAFRDCTLSKPALATPTQAPILFQARQRDREDIGGVIFDHLVIDDPLGRQPLGFVDAAGNIIVQDVRGTLVLARDGQRETVEITEARLREWMPALNLKRIAPYDTSDVSFRPLQDAGGNLAPLQARLRHEGHAVLYAEQGDEVTLKVDYGQVGKYAGRVAPIRVTAPSGEECARGEAPFKGQGEVSFTAPETGLYRVDAEAGANWVRFAESNYPLCLSGEKGPIHFLATNGSLYFYVPAGTPEFGLKIFGEGTGEGVKAGLYNPAGELVEEQDDITQVHQFVVERPAAEGQVWCLKLGKASNAYHEDHYVDILGVPPFLAGSPEAVLAPVRE